MMQIYFKRQLSLFLLCISASVFGQNFFDLHPEIPKFVDNVNSTLTTLKAITLKNQEFLETMTDGGGELTGYFKGDKVVKITSWVGLSYGIEKYDFYYKGGDLYYVQENLDQFLYNAGTDQWDHSKTQVIYSGWYLFGEQFDLMTFGHDRFDLEEGDPEDKFKELSKEYVGLLIRKL